MKSMQATLYYYKRHNSSLDKIDEAMCEGSKLQPMSLTENKKSKLREQHSAIF